MKLLVIGGTEFVGRNMVERALANGHKVTLFYRGRKGNDLFPEAERIIADRDGGMDALGDRKWDAVLDTCGYVPRVVRQSTQALLNRVDSYIFISTISVYARLDQPGQDENAQLATLEDPTVEEITGETYGGLKVLCESEVRTAYPNHHLIIRPGLICGPWDKTDRFTYWPVRVARGGDMLILDRPDMPMQFIDARDLAEFTISMIERKEQETFNATGPLEPYTFAKVLETCQAVSSVKPNFIPVPGPWLEAQGVEIWRDLPLSISAESDRDGLVQVDVSRAVSKGLKFRPLEQTVADTLEWYQAQGSPELVTGFKPADEQQLIERWRAQQGSALP